MPSRHHSTHRSTRRRCSLCGFRFYGSVAYKDIEAQLRFVLGNSANVDDQRDPKTQERKKRTSLSQTLSEKSTSLRQTLAGVFTPTSKRLYFPSVGRSAEGSGDWNDADRERAGPEEQRD